MKILYDHQAFTMQRYGGVSKCFCELISHMPSSAECELSVATSENVHLIESGLCPDLDTNIGFCLSDWKKKYNGPLSGAIYKRLSRYIDCIEGVNTKQSICKLKTGNFDVFHPTFFDPYFLSYIKDKPFVVTVHDMMPEIFRFAHTDVKNKIKLCKKASKIIAVSNKTKEDLCSFVDIPEDKVVVIHHGGPKISNNHAKSKFDYSYFLYVGQRGNYKNSDKTLSDFSMFVKRHPAVKMIFTGPAFSREENELIESLGLENNVAHCFPTDEELVNLYANALAFIYPSLYEGFGMPILEAYAHGCPVLLNNKSCFPEIAGNAALYFESDGTHSNLHELLERFIKYTQEERTILINAGYDRLKQYTWEQSSKQLFEVYKSII